LVSGGTVLSEESKLILITDFIEQKVRKEQELEYYLNELSELNRKIGFLRQEVDLTNTIINMIKAEQVHDVKERMVERLDNQIIRGNDDLG
jgi:anion-transporting  ArsA/GET3 family ATPase